MSDMTAALGKRIRQDGAVAAITTRVNWVIVPQDTPLPFIRLQVISDPRPEHLKGYNAERQTRVQADCFDKTYGGARTLAEAVVAAVEQPATVSGIKFGRTSASGPIDLGEDIDGLGFVHRMSLDLLVQHRPA